MDRSPAWPPRSAARLQMLAAGTVIVIVSFVFDGTALPMVATIAVCSVFALALTLITLNGRELAPQAAE